LKKHDFFSNNEKTVLFISLIMSIDLPKTSKEQYEIIKKLNDNNFVIVGAVARSGKTTSNLHISFLYQVRFDY